MAVLQQSHAPVSRAEVPWALSQGIIAGILAGLVFAAYEMLVSWALGQGFFTPLRMIAGILLGEAALDPSYALAGPATVGVIVHMVLAVIYGVVFALIAGAVRSYRGMLLAGAVYGLLLWTVNFYVIAPEAYPWFLDSPPLAQFIGHTFFFGLVLGAFIFRSHERFVARRT